MILTDDGSDFKTKRTIKISIEVPEKEEEIVVEEEKEVKSTVQIDQPNLDVEISEYE